MTKSEWMECINYCRKLAFIERSYNDWLVIDQLMYLLEKIVR